MMMMMMIVRVWNPSASQSLLVSALLPTLAESAAPCALVQRQYLLLTAEGWKWNELGLQYSIQAENISEKKV